MGGTASSRARYKPDVVHVPPRAKVSPTAREKDQEGSNYHPEFVGLKPEVIIYLLMTTHDLRETMSAKLLDLFRAQYSEKSPFSILPLDCLRVIRDYYLLLFRATENGWPFKVKVESMRYKQYDYSHMLPYKQTDVIDVIEPHSFLLGQNPMARHPHGKRIGFLGMGSDDFSKIGAWPDYGYELQEFNINQTAIATRNSNAVLPIELSFRQGDKLSLVRKQFFCWYEAKRGTKSNLGWVHESQFKITVS